mgnify:CR=1 FL=1
MEKITNVKLKVAIGLGGGGCVVEAIDINDNPLVKTDLDEYGGCLGDFFHEGAVPPKEAGIYLFDGVARGYPGSDEMYSYQGEFKKV